MIKRISVVGMALLLMFSSWFNIIPTLSNDVHAAAYNYLAHYPLLENVEDISGNDNHGQAVGNITYQDGLTLPGGTNSNTNYVKLPDGLFDNQDSVTISVWIKSNTGSGNYAALFFGTPPTGNVPSNYWLFNPTNPSGNFKSVFTDSTNVSSPWTTEVGVGSHPTTGYFGEWVHYTTVLTETSITGYVNGQIIETVNKTKPTSSFGTGLNAYIGRSNYVTDHTFAGSFQDLRIIGEALSQGDVASLYQLSFNEQQVQLSKKELSLGDLSAVIGPIILPATDSRGAIITWESSDENVISPSGEVFLQESEQIVTLTATITLGESTVTKEFTAIVLSIDNASIAVEGVSLNKNSLTLTVGASETLTATITPSNASNKKVTWTSSDTGVATVDQSGKVRAVAVGDATIVATTEDGEFTASASITVNESTLRESLILHYDMKTTETVDGQLILKDVADKEVTYDGIFKNPNNGQHIANNDVGFVSFNGGSSTSNSGYVEIPKGSNNLDLLDGLDAITVSSIVNWTNDGTNRWIFGLGTVLTPETNKYFFVTPRHGSGSGNQIATGISKQGWPNEALVTGAANSYLVGGQWKHVTVSFSEASNTISLYVDGVRVASGNAKGLKLSEIIDHNAAFSGFLGKSIFSNDPYLQGSIADFKVFNIALTDQQASELYSYEGANHINQIRQLTVEDAANALNITSYLGEGDISEDKITKSLSLPTAGKNGVSITWSSNRTDVIANNGVVTRPAVDAANVQVELTASVTYQGVSTSTIFTVTVLKEFDDEQIVNLDADALTIYNPSNVKGHLRLALNGEQGSTITWVSSNPAVIKGSVEAGGSDKQLGWVTRQATDTDVTLTATITSGSASVQRSFDVTVVKAPAAIDYDAYFFAYFTGEYEGGEEISFATAEDPLYWRALNNGKSILQSELGEKGLRDPFVIRSAEGDKFYMLATDLKMGESTNFDQAQITGSHYIMIWESEDLVNWSEQRMIEVAPKNGGNTWAPEAIYDEATGEYIVFWASSMKNSDTYGDYNGRPNGQYNVMYYATTRDFYHFSEPKVMIDESLPTIDTTFIEHNETLYRFTKSEVNFKVYVEKANNFYYDKDGIEANGFQFEAIPGTRDGKNGLIGHSGNNEGQTIFKDLDEDKWYLFLDSWPYHVRYTTDLENASQYINNLLPSSQYALPPGPRHGTVIPITRAEYDALQQKYAVPGPVESEQPVVHYSFDPDTVAGTTITDVSGNGYDAALVGGAAINSDDIIGENGGALELDGSTGYVKLPDHLIQSLNLEKATFATWVKLDKNQQNQRIFDFASETGRQVNRNTMYLSTQGDTGNLEFAIVTPFTEKFSNDSTLLGSSYKYAVRGNSLLATDAWQHIAITIDGFDAVLYVNGNEVARSSTYNVEPRMLLETTMNYIGKSRRGSDSLFDGKFDDFRIYNRALSAEEVTQLADQDVPPPVQEPSGSELILHYDMNNIEGNKVKDATGNFDGNWVNSTKGEWIHTSDAGVLSFTGGTNSTYVEIPNGVLNDVSDITVSTLVNWSGKGAAEWMYALGRPNTSTHYLYFTPRYNADSSSRFGIATNGWRDEVSAKSSMLSANEWKLITTVLSQEKGTLTLYVDGVAVASAPTQGMTLDQIKNATGISGYLGRSFYTEDPYFGGMIADFQIYNGAMNAAEIAELKLEADEKIEKMGTIFLEAAAEKLNYSHILGANESENSVVSNLTLPQSGEYGTTITWTSSNTAVIGVNGAVTRPAYEAGDQTVTLTATLSDGESTIAKDFVVIVTKLPNDAQAVQLDRDALIVHNISDVRGHLTLPAVGENGSTITWQSENTELITATGEVTRPAHGSGDVIVKMTATITRNAASTTREFSAVVKELPEQEDYAGYFFTYFTGEGKANGEQIYFALSDGNNALSWRELNNGNPVLTSDLGEQGLRDPFIIRSPEGDKFYMIATDLKIHGNGNWGRAQQWGSRSIMVWESNDLVNWSEQRMVEVAPEEAGNTWAPEIMYDHTTGEYVVFWASKLYDNPEHTGSAYQKMMYSKTRDFYTFTEPQIYMDYGFSVIDTTMIEYDGKIYRFSKDERNNEAASPYGKMIFQEVGDSVLDEDFQLINQGVGNIKWVEGPTIFKSNTEEKWYLFVDEFGGRGYVPFETTDLASGEWVLSSNYSLPSSPRHGTVIPITQSEYDAIFNQYLAVRVTGVTLNKSQVTLNVGESSQLTATVTPANATNKAVSWSSSNNAIATVSANGLVTAIGAGTATITVTTADGGFTKTATITVAAIQEPDTTPPGEVSGATVEAGDGTLTLNWTNPTDEDLEKISISGHGESASSVEAVEVDKAVNSYTFTGLTNGQRYEFIIVTVDRSGNESEGVVVFGTPIADEPGENDTTPPEEVSKASVAAGNGSLTLRWTNPTDEDLAKVIIRGYGDNDITPVELSKDKVSHTFTSLSNGKRYQFIIVTVDASGNESAGVVVSGTPVRPSSGNTDGGSTVTPEPQGDSVEVKTNGEVSVKPTVNADGAVEVKLNSSVMQEAINKSVGNELHINLTNNENMNQLAVELPIDDSLRRGSAGIDSIKIKSDFATVSVSTDLFAKASAPAETVKLIVAKVEQSTLPAHLQSELQNSTVYDIHLEINGTRITELDGINDLVVELPYELKEGQDPNHIIIYWIKDNGELAVERNGKYNAATGKVEFKPNHLSKFTVVYVKASFTDVTQGWAKEAVEALAARNIVKGVGEGQFNPDGQVTRAEFITMLMNAFGLTDAGATSSFTDVKQGTWYYAQVATAQQLGIVNGKTDGSFGIHDAITRQDMAVMVYKAMEVMNLKLSTEKAAMFNDQEHISAYAQKAVNAMHASGIINGMGNGNFAPKDNASRAQAAVIIYNVLNAW